ncbi:hypothetical protein BUE80_DR006462 [Diplocarpon rosae]|nr:hypothetical protein BUE80_DR006462 [Diplocarpon rosae]
MVCNSTKCTVRGNADSKAMVCQNTTLPNPSPAVKIVPSQYSGNRGCARSKQLLAHRLWPSLCCFTEDEDVRRFDARSTALRETREPMRSSSALV